MTDLLNSNFVRWLIGIGLVSMISMACKSEGPFNVSDNERMIAQGFWQASHEDVVALQQDGISALGWFAIETQSSPDTISVTWPSPLGCTSSPGQFTDKHELNFIASEVEVDFAFLDENTAAASYSQDGKTATLLYQKVSDDATVICF